MNRGQTGAALAVVVACVIGAGGIGGLAASALAAGTQQRLLDRPRENGRADDRGLQETETVNRTVALPPKGTVRIRNFSGEIRITPAPGNDVVLKATRRATRDALDHVRLEVTTSGSVVEIQANDRDPAWARARRDNDVVETDMELQVPPSADLDVDAFSSDVIIDGMNADQRIKTFSGQIEIRGLRGEIDAETFSADIRVTMAAAAKGNVSFNSFSGSFNSDLPVSVSTAGRGRRNQFDGALPAGDGPRLRFKTFSGNVDLRTR